MNAKKLDQSVFEGLPSKYRWAAVDADGETCAYEVKPDCQADIGRWTRPESRGGLVFFGAGFDGSDFQNSLIERQDVPKADIDWSRQEVPAGATHINTHGQFLRKHDQIGWMQFWGSDWIAVKFTESDIAAFREIPKPTPQVDWSKAPEGATHYNSASRRWFFACDDGRIMSFDGDMWSVLLGYTVADLESAAETIKRPESITDVARSIEAARVAEKVEGTPFVVELPYADGDERYNARYFEVSPVQRDAIQIADAATQHMRDRAATYDQPEGERSMCRAVDAFNSITGRDLAESDGWLLLQLLKDARQWSNAAYHQDSAEDCIAYAALKAEALERGK